MDKPVKKEKPTLDVLSICPTGITGVDEITGEGLPKGRPTLVCGGTGCGKTLLAMEFLVRGATQFNEPGVYMPYEEKSEELAKNFASLGLSPSANVPQSRSSGKSRSFGPAMRIWKASTTLLWGVNSV